MILPKRYYTGIGSRETPPDILAKMGRIAEILSQKGFVLRSGGAPGADSAFEDFHTGSKIIYLPWKKFNGKIQDDEKYFVPKLNLDIVKQFHPAYNKLSDQAKKLMSRNSYQVLGDDLQTPSEFIICWTKDGKASGGTGQAIRIAHHYNIPVYNLYNKQLYYF